MPSITEMIDRLILYLWNVLGFRIFRGPEYIILILEAPKSKTTSGNMFTGIDILYENQFYEAKFNKYLTPDN